MTKLIPLFLFSLGLSAHAESPLAGNYALHQADCINAGIPDYAIRPAQVQVQADDSNVNYLLAVNVFGQNGYQAIMHFAMPVGAFTHKAFGDGSFRTVGEYSEGQNKYVYSEYESSSQGPKFIPLRTTTLELSGGALVITEKEADGNPRVCTLTKMN